MKEQNTFLVAAFLILFFSLLFSSLLRAQTSIDAGDRENRQSCTSLVEKAFAAGKLDLDTRILYLAYSIADPSKLPQEFQSTASEKCGTWIFDEVKRNWHLLSNETKRIIDEYNIALGILADRPAGLDSTRTSTNFKIHYSIRPGDANAVSVVDNDGNGTPDYVDRVMQTLEDVWNYEITTMGYVAPPQDSIAGGDGKYDVYLMKIGTLYGYVAPETKTGNNPNSPTVNEINAYTSYMALRNNYDGFPLNELQAIQVTAAHEFFHSIQFGYDAWEKSWLKEATATWCEDEVYDDVNDNYQYLNSWFSQPWVPLDATEPESAGHWYGSWIFFRYISENFGGRNTIRRLWERSVNYNSQNGDFSFNAIGDALNEQGTNFQDVFRKFTVANFYKIISPFHYEEGDNYPSIKTSALYVETDKTLVNSLKRRAAQYYIVSPNRLPRGADITNMTFTTSDSATQSGIQVATRSENTVNAIPFASDYSLTPTQNLDNIVIIVMNFDTAGIINRYSLRVQTNSKLHQLTFNNYDDDYPVMSSGIVSWAASTPGPSLGRLYNKISTVEIFNIAEVNEGEAAWKYPFTWNDGSTTNAIAYYNGAKTSGAIGSPLYDIIDTKPFVHKGKIAFVGTDISTPRQNAIYLSDSSKTPVRISEYFPPEIWLDIHQVDNGQIIWSRHFYMGDIDSVYWYNGTSNVLPPTKFRMTIPRLQNGKLVWCESRSDNFYDPLQKELYYFDGMNKLQLTNDNVNDGYPDFDAGQIAWIRDGKTAFYNGSSIKILADSITGLPKNARAARISNGKVAWVSMDDFSFQEAIFLYDGKSIAQISPWLDGVSTPPFGNQIGRVALSNNQIAFSMRRGNQEIFIYTHHDSVLTSVAESKNQSPKKFALLQNYPNPFNPTTTIRYSLPNVGTRHAVSLRIYDLLGREVATLVNEEQSGGRKEVQWNAGNVASGIYFYKLTAGDYIEVKKMMIIK